MKNAFLISILAVLTGMSCFAAEGSFRFPFYSGICGDGYEACPPLGQYGGGYNTKVNTTWVSIINDSTRTLSYRRGDRVQLKVYTAGGTLKQTSIQTIVLFLMILQETASWIS